MGLMSHRRTLATPSVRAAVEAHDLERDVLLEIGPIRPISPIRSHKVPAAFRLPRCLRDLPTIAPISQIHAGLPIIPRIHANAPEDRYCTIPCQFNYPINE